MATTLVWDAAGERDFETGVDRGVLYPFNLGTSSYDTGVAWNGLTEVDEKPDGAGDNPQYADNIKYLSLRAAETFGGTIQAYTYPDEFGPCDGTAAPVAGVSVGQQTRQTFGMSYRTQVGNDENSAAGYKLHLVYGCTASPSEKDYASINDSPAPVAFSWDFTTAPVGVTGYKPTSLLVIDSTKVNATALSNLENMLYGDGGTTPELPLPDDVLALFTGTVTTATPTAPTQAGDVVTIPAVTGVTYYADGEPVTGSLTITKNTIVTAKPNKGYIFPPETDNDWEFIFS